MTSVPDPHRRDDLKAGSAPGHASEILAKQLDTAFQPLDPTERVILLRHRVAGDLIFTTSFGLKRP